MKLSEAIRLGAMMKPKASGYFYIHGATCAQGAALDAVGKLLLDDPEKDWSVSVVMHESMRQTWPWLFETEAVCPACQQDMTGNSIIAHLNNRSGHEWTREEIADWVETLEAAQAIDQPASERCGTTAMAQPVLAPRA